MALNVDFQGVWTNPNPHSKVPAGAAERAENVVNPKPGQADTVPGQETLVGNYSASDERLSSGVNYQGCFVESTRGATPKLYLRDTTVPSLTAYSGSFAPPSGVQRIPFAEAGEKLYFATSAGLRVIDGAAGAVAAVGIIAPFPPNPVTVATPGLPFTIANGSSVGYRAVFRRPDSKGAYIISAPSGRNVLVNNDGVSRGIGITQFLPQGIVAGDSYLAFRTAEAATSASPGDLMFQVYERVISAGDISTGSFSFIDNTPDTLRGEPLYTNANADGILRQNERPPLAAALLAFDDFLLVANVAGAQRFTQRMLALPAVGSTITIDGLTYTASMTHNPATGEYSVLVGGTVGEQIAQATANLIDVINRRTANTTVYAYLQSTEVDPPGIFMIEKRDVTAAAFTTQASNGTQWEPPLDTAKTSLATVEENGVWVSKRGQHYAFPPLRSAGGTYRFRVGNTGRDILKMVGLREAVIVFVDGEGVWKIRRTGNESWRVDPINTTTHLLVPESVAVVDNQVVALTTRGVVTIDEGGVEEIDLPIKDQIEALKELQSGVVLPHTFAVSDEARLRYILYHPRTNVSTAATHAWVYNADQGTWTERTDAASGGFVGAADGRLYLGSALGPNLTRERAGNESQVYLNPDGTGIAVRIDWTVMDEGDPGAEKQYTELRLLTRNAITGAVTFACTNDLGGSESTTGSTSDNPTGEPFVRAEVPDGCQRTSRLKVSVQRTAQGQAFSVVGLKALLAGMYDGDMTR